MSNADESNKKLEGSPVNRLTKPSTLPKAVIPPEALKGFIELSASIQPYLEQNRQIIEQFAREAAFQKSIIEKLNLNLVAPIEVRRLLDEQIKYLDLHKAFQSPALELANTVNVSIARLLAETSIPAINDLLKQIAFPSDAWRERLRALDEAAAAFAHHHLALQSHLADIARYSVLSQASLSRLPWDEIGNALDVQAPIRRVLQDTFVDFTQTYSRLFGSFQEDPTIVALLPPIASKLSAVEYFVGVEVVDAITIKPTEDIDFLKEKQEATEEVRGETGDRLETLLGKLNRDLITPLYGARQSLDSSNPDRVRHFAVSLRELFTHVLHTLAPDGKVKAWSDAPDYYDDKYKPTRRARLLYICQTLNQEPFSRFLEKDIDALLEFLQLFQRGTHEVAPKYNETQLRVMLARMESALRLLLEIWITS